jgi:hypothetical protein
MAYGIIIEISSMVTIVATIEGMCMACRNGKSWIREPIFFGSQNDADGIFLAVR